MFNRLLGTTDQMRIELETLFKTKRIQLKSYDGQLIDCFLVFGKNAPNVSNSIIQPDDHFPGTFSACKPDDVSGKDIQISEGVSADPEVDIGPTILFCNPNAGYYEFMFYESEWIEFYHKRNINLFLWNYRGYC